MGTSRRPARPRFEQPGQHTADRTSEASSPPRGQDDQAYCALPECGTPIARLAGRENQVRYCCRQHRSIARIRRCRAQYSDEE